MWRGRWLESVERNMYEYVGTRRIEEVSGPEEMPRCSFCGARVMRSKYALARARKLKQPNLYCDAKCFGLSRRGPRAVMAGRHCRKCGAELTDATWHRSHQKARDNICKGCYAVVVKKFEASHQAAHRTRAARWRHDNPDKVKRSLARWAAMNAEHCREYRRRKKPHMKNLNLKRVHGISLDDYKAMLAKQSGRCAICGKHPQVKSLNVDHDHTTGRIRGLLCVPCNTWLGRFENLEFVRKSIAYLRATGSECGMPFEGFF